MIYFCEHCSNEGIYHLCEDCAEEIEETTQDLRVRLAAAEAWAAAWKLAAKRHRAWAAKLHKWAREDDATAAAEQRNRQLVVVLEAVLRYGEAIQQCVDSPEYMASLTEENIDALYSAMLEKARAALADAESCVSALGPSALYRTVQYGAQGRRAQGNDNEGD